MPVVAFRFTRVASRLSYAARSYTRLSVGQPLRGTHLESKPHPFRTKGRVAAAADRLSLRMLHGTEVSAL